MKTFPTNFITEKNKKTGIAPVWILQITVDSTDYYISDDAFTVASWNGGITTLPWIQTWGQIIEAISGVVGESRVAEFDVSCIVDQDDASNILVLAANSGFEKSPVKLFFWMRGLDAAADPPQEMFRGYLKDVDIPDETVVNLVLEDETIRMHNQVGNLVTQANYSNADPDDIGRILPLPYGLVQGYFPVATEAGLLTSLSAGITAAATSMTVARPDGVIANTTVFRIGSEDVKVTAVNGDVLTITRAQNGTTAATHSAGDPLLERKITPFVFVAGDHPVTSIDKIIVRGSIDVEVTDLVTLYTGNTGNEYTGYSGKAVVTISQAQADLIQARIAGAGGISDPGHTHDSPALTVVVPIDDYVVPSGSWYIGANYVIDGNLNSGGICENYTSYGTSYFKRVQPFNRVGMPIRYRFAIHQGGDPIYNYGIIYNTNTLLANTSTKQTKYLSWVTIDSWDDIQGLELKIQGGNGGRARIWEIWIEVEYDPSTPIASTGISGNSVIDSLLGGPLLADVTAPDTDPDDVIANILDTWCGFSSLTVQGTMPATYKFNGVILNQINAMTLLNQLAFQCRSFFRMIAGTAKLIVRPDTLSSDKSIPDCRIESGQMVLSRRKTDIFDIINNIDLRYSRDWSTGKSLEAYKEISSNSDATSITDYGQKEMPDLFCFDFITDSTIAAAMVTFYLAKYKRRRWLYTFEVYLDHVEIEFGDSVTLAFLASQVAEVMESKIQPGSTQNIDRIAIVAEA